MRTEAAEQTSEAVHGLIEACEDGHDGYHAAAGGVVDGSLRNILESFSEERARFAADLRAAFERAGGQLHNVHEHPGGVWSKVQALAQRGDAAAILPECERGENYVLDRYAEALDQDLPWELEQIVERQYFQVLHARDRIRLLERVLGSPSH
jgi:uncharacterized protein (TIGR02284 family)